MGLEGFRISDKKQAILKRMQIHDIMDFLTYYPFRYEQIQELAFISWQVDEKVSFQGTILTKASVFRFGGKKSMTRFKVLFEETEIQVVLFNRPWTSQFQVGKEITIFGKYEGSYKVLATQYNFSPLKEQIGIVPIYYVKDGISQKEMCKWIRKAYDVKQGQIMNFIPDIFIQKYKLISCEKALHDIHFPKSKEALQQSLRYLKYEEFFRFQFLMQAMKQQEQTIVHGCEKHFDMNEVFALEKTLDFKLTKDQTEAIMDILKDLKNDKTMYRMIQGDVGSGKTLVAALGMYACVLAHKQAALLAPTEILAKQHYANLKQLFQGFAVRVEVLYSSMKEYDKKAILNQLKHNEIDMIIGTHALFQGDVDFYDLGMVVTDEQHRFGVEQRRKMLRKGEKIDFLLMSATPIPRTLALSLYGDMDVSTIEMLPVGRKPIITSLIQDRSMKTILSDILKKIDEGNQCYVVCPAIEKNEDFDLLSAIDIYEGMDKTLGKKYRIGLLHGKMSSEDKDEVMESFVNKQIDILVSTTVIEVGVDVKAANIMVIYDAHRFGMSQIHQLRGRIGRGEQQGYCYLLTDSKDVDTLNRLNIVANTQDGFEIARQDLMIRGPGDVLGVRQSGVPGFVLGDVIKDSKILEITREDAQYVWKHIDEKEFENLKAYASKHIQNTTYVD